MKKAIFTIAILLFTIFSFAQTSTYVNGYTRSNGTYVQGYYRTTPKSTRNDNYSTVGNTNPYTGTYGTKPRDGYNSTATYSSSVYSTPSYSSSSYYSTPGYSTSTYSCSSYGISSYSSSSYYSAPTYSTPNYTVPVYKTTYNW
jgi:hypothetical protein